MNSMTVILKWFIQLRYILFGIFHEQDLHQVNYLIAQLQQLCENGACHITSCGRQLLNHFQTQALNVSLGQLANGVMPFKQGIHESKLRALLIWLNGLGFVQSLVSMATQRSFNLKQPLASLCRLTRILRLIGQEFSCLTKVFVSLDQGSYALCSQTLVYLIRTRFGHLMKLQS